MGGMTTYVAKAAMRRRGYTRPQRGPLQRISTFALQAIAQLCLSLGYIYGAGNSMTNETNQAPARAPRYRRLLKRLLILAGIVLLLWGAAALNARILPVKRFSQLTRWYTPAQAEQNFNA